MSDESETVYEFSVSGGERWAQSWPNDEVKARLAAGEGPVLFGHTLWRIRPGSPAAAADPFAAVKELPEFRELVGKVSSPIDPGDGLARSWSGAIQVAAIRLVAALVPEARSMLDDGDAPAPSPPIPDPSDEASEVAVAVRMLPEYRAYIDAAINVAAAQYLGKRPDRWQDVESQAAAALGRAVAVAAAPPDAAAAAEATS